MESESLQPQMNPEHVVAPPSEYGEKMPLQNPEKGVEGSAEKFEQRSEAGAGAADATPMLPPPIPLTAAQTPISDTSVTNDAPLIANDDDLIEKEWVDKAKKIIIETKDDPYHREEAVGKLQRDYLEKRYGRHIGSANDAI